MQRNNPIILNDGQQKILEAAVNWYKNSSEQVFEIDGAAGTGKSVLIYQILNAIHLGPREYYAMAYTGAASIVMRTKGFPSAKSIHSTLYETIEIPDYDDKLSMEFGVPKKRYVFQLKAPYAIDPEVKLFFIDEAYMVPKYMVNDILSFGIKVIACGDAHQLPPIGDEPGFLTGYNVHHLTQLMRQSENDPIVYLAMRAMNGLPIHCGNYGNVMVINDDEFIPEMIGYADIVICGTNRTKESMNSYVRHLAGFGDYKLPHYGERLICRDNNWQEVIDDIALANGLIGTVTNNPDPTKLNSNIFTFDFKPDLCNAAFHNVRANYEYFISDTDRKNEIRKEAKEVKYNIGDLFDFGYCITTHLAQGSEAMDGIYIEEFLRAQTQNQLLYTGITRFKRSLIYIKKKNRTFYFPKNPL